MTTFAQKQKSPASFTRPAFSLSRPSLLSPVERTPFGPSRPLVQTKLTMNEPGDKHEQQADRTVAEVMRSTAGPWQASVPAGVQTVGCNNGHTLSKTADASPTPRMAHNFGKISMFPPPPQVQAKLTVNQPGDKYEQEADRIADLVMRMPDSAGHDVSQSPATLQRKCTACESGGTRCPKCVGEGDEKIQLKPLASQITPLVQRRENRVAAPEVMLQAASQINSLRGGGQPLPDATRRFFEPRFGVDFGAVRVHTSPHAAVTANRIDAQAYTIGHNIVFGHDQFNPTSSAGKHLLAHELAHTIQQCPHLTEPTASSTIPNRSQPMPMIKTIPSSTPIMQLKSSKDVVGSERIKEITESFEKDAKSIGLSTAEIASVQPYIVQLKLAGHLALAELRNESSERMHTTYEMLKRNIGLYIALTSPNTQVGTTEQEIAETLAKGFGKSSWSWSDHWAYSLTSNSFGNFVSDVIFQRGIQKLAQKYMDSPLQQDLSKLTSHERELWWMNHFTPDGPAFARTQQLLRRRAQLGKAASWVTSGIPGFLVGVIIEMAIGFLFDYAFGKADELDRLLGEVEARGAMNVLMENFKLWDEEEKAKKNFDDQIKPLVDALNTNNTNVKELNHTVIALEAFLKEAKSQPKLSVTDYDVYEKLMHDWLLEYAGDENDPGSNISSYVWKRNLKYAKNPNVLRKDWEPEEEGSDLPGWLSAVPTVLNKSTGKYLYNTPELFAYQTRRHWIDVGLEGKGAPFAGFAEDLIKRVKWFKEHGTSVDEIKRIFNRPKRQFNKTTRPYDFYYTVLEFGQHPAQPGYGVVPRPRVGSWGEVIRGKPTWAHYRDAIRSNEFRCTTWYDLDLYNGSLYINGWFYDIEFPALRKTGLPDRLGAAVSPDARVNWGNVD